MSSSLDTRQALAVHLFNSVPDAIVGISRSGRVIDCNPSFEAMVGKKRDDLLGVRFSRIGLVSDFSPARAIAVFAKMLHGETLAPFTISFRSPGATERMLEVQASPIKSNEVIDGITAILHDVTVEHRAREALRHEHEKMVRLIETSPVGIVQVDTTGLISFANARAEQILGLTQSSIANRMYNDPEWRIAALDGEAFPDEQLPFMRVQTEKAPVFNICHALEWPDGKRVVLSICAAPLSKSDGSFDGMIASLDDITERLALEEQLRQTEKMVAVGQLAGGIAHDFNNQLAAIMGYAELIKDALPDRPELERYADNILRSTGRSSDLTNQLLAFARKGKYQISTIDIHAILDEALELLERSIDKKVEIVKKYHARPLLVDGDRNQLINVFLNLGINAAEAMPGGGDFIVETAPFLFEHMPQSAEAHGDRYVQIVVRDNGCGMSSAVQRRIFEPFFTTKEQGQGIGMGLPAVYGTIQNHHGKISVESAPGSGTTFRILLPRTTPPADELETVAAEQPIEGGAAHILVIDDEPMVRELAGDMLRAGGYHVTLFGSAPAAMEWYRKNYFSVSAALLDIVMPGMDGFTVQDELRKLNPAIITIFCSGHSSDNAREQIQDLKWFIQKPYRKAALLELVKQALA